MTTRAVVPTLAPSAAENQTLGRFWDASCESRAKEAVSARFRSKSDQRTGTPNQEIPGYLRPVLRERIGAQSIAEMDRDAVAIRDRQLQALKATMT